MRAALTGFLVMMPLAFIAPPTSASVTDLSHLRAGERFPECLECPSVTIVPGGHFTMTAKAAGDGRKDEDPEGMRKTRPERGVDIPEAFGLGTYPVTRREYQVFVRTTHRATIRGCHIQLQGAWVLDPTKDWQHPGFAQTQGDPVVCVSWHDAQDYLQWLNDLTRTSSHDAASHPYRLPTWEEMEYATRAGTATRYYWGDTPQRQHANYGRIQCLPCGPMQDGADRWLYTSPVGSFPANPWGLYDMAGNVWQWVESCRPEPNAVPAKDCPVQVLHGGSWLTNPEYLQTGERSSARPWHRNTQIGFRVARTLDTGQP